MNRHASAAALYAPIPKSRVLAMRLAKGTYEITSLGLEKQCNTCHEFWPADTEFWSPQPKQPTGLHCMCRACYAEWKATRPKAA